MWNLTFQNYFSSKTDFYFMCAQTQVWSFEKGPENVQSAPVQNPRPLGNRRTKIDFFQKQIYGSSKFWILHKFLVKYLRMFDKNIWNKIMNRFRRKFQMIVHRQVGTKDEMVGRKENRFALIQRMQDNIHNLPRNVQQSWRKKLKIETISYTLRSVRNKSDSI